MVQQDGTDKAMEILKTSGVFVEYLFLPLLSYIVSLMTDGLVPGKEGGGGGGVEVENPLSVTFVPLCRTDPKAYSASSEPLGKLREASSR